MRFVKSKNIYVGFFCSEFLFRPIVKSSGKFAKLHASNRFTADELRMSGNSIIPPKRSPSLHSTPSRSRSTAASLARQDDTFKHTDF